MSRMRSTLGELGAPGSSALVTGTSRTTPASASPPLSMREATSAVAPTTEFAMSFARCGDDDVTSTWIRGDPGSTT